MGLAADLRCMGTGWWRVLVSRVPECRGLGAVISGGGTEILIVGAGELRDLLDSEEGFRDTKMNRQAVRVYCQAI